MSFLAIFLGRVSYPVLLEGTNVRMDSRLPQDRVSVRSAASVGLATAMLPGSSLSFIHLRKLLFDDQPFLAISDGMKQTAERMVRDSYESGLDQLGYKDLCDNLALRIRTAFSRR
jgi:hypothetical protein